MKSKQSIKTTCEKNLQLFQAQNKFVPRFRLVWKKLLVDVLSGFYRKPQQNQPKKLHVQTFYIFCKVFFKSFACYRTRTKLSCKHTVAADRILLKQTRTLGSLCQTAANRDSVAERNAKVFTGTEKVSSIRNSDVSLSSNFVRQFSKFKNILSKSMFSPVTLLI